MNITLENYEEKRRELVGLNSNLLGVVLRENEEKLDEYLKQLKQEYRDLYGGRVPYDMPVLTDKKLTGSRLYEFCRKLPKGADLHVHDMALMPVRKLIPVLLKCDEFCINLDHKSYDLKWIKTGEAVPEGYKRFKACMEEGLFTKDELIKNWTVAGVKDSGMNIWDYFEELFVRQGCLSDNPDFASVYYDEAFRYYINSGIMHVEIHIMLTEDENATAKYLSAMYKAYENVKKDYPFFTLKLIGAGVKADSTDLSMTKTCFANAIKAREIFKDTTDKDNISNLIIGFDLVNEEDTSLPLRAFAPMLLELKDEYPEMKFYIHSGESLDAENENLIDAYLLGVSRVGHGLNLYRYPDLLERYVKSEICLELCAISNETLGYTVDIRNHPATEYLRQGVALALCSDDPQYMENETLTDDFFAAVTGWNLGIADIKQLGINSIIYSGLSEHEKNNSLKNYNRMWNDFVNSYAESLNKQ